MEAEYGTYEYEKEKGVEKERIKFWYRQAGFLIYFELSHLLFEESMKMSQYFLLTL